MNKNVRWHHRLVIAIQQELEKGCYYFLTCKIVFFLESSRRIRFDDSKCIKVTEEDIGVNIDR